MFDMIWICDKMLSFLNIRLLFRFSFDRSWCKNNTLENLCKHDPYKICTGQRLDINWCCSQASAAVTGGCARPQPSHLLVDIFTNYKSSWCQIVRLECCCFSWRPAVICSSSWKRINLLDRILDRILDWIGSRTGSWIGSLTAEEVDPVASMAGEAAKIGTPRPGWKYHLFDTFKDTTIHPRGKKFAVSAFWPMLNLSSSVLQ